jgi:hypothetical protein
VNTKPNYFFLTIANYPLSGNIDKYLATLKKNKSDMLCCARAIFIIGQFELLTGGTKPVSRDDNRGVSLFAEQDVVTFEQQRNILVKALEHVVSDQGLEKSGDFIRCTVIANKLEQTPNFILGSKAGGETKVVKSGMNITDVGEKTPEIVLLEDIFNFACYTLMSFLVSNDRRKIKKCPYCNLFFIAKDSKRKRCYSESCNREYEKKKKQEQRTNDPVKYV